MKKELWTILALISILLVWVARGVLLLKSKTNKGYVSNSQKWHPNIQVQRMLRAITHLAAFFRGCVCVVTRAVQEDDTGPGPSRPTCSAVLQESPH